MEMPAAAAKSSSVVRIVALLGVCLAMASGLTACASGPRPHGGHLVDAGDLKGTNLVVYRTAECFSEPDRAPLPAPSFTYELYRTTEGEVLVRDLSEDTLLVVTNRWDAADGTHFYVKIESGVESAGPSTVRLIPASADEFVLGRDRLSLAKRVVYDPSAQGAGLRPASSPVAVCSMEPYFYDRRIFGRAEQR